MTQEEKNIKICEALGWAIHDTSTGFGRHKEAAHSATIPNHFTDLNAMHEAEKWLNGGQINTYLGHLYRYSKPASVGSNPWEAVAVRVAVHAPASQRAEAFGLTLNLWKQEN